MLIIPAIDLREGRCVRLQQGERDSASIYDDDPVAVSQRFADSGATIIHVVDLDGAFDGKSANRSIVESVVAHSRVAVQFGGGVRTERDIEQLIESGVSRVILGTLATESADTLKHLVKRFGSRICVGIDARDGVVMTRGWQTTTDLSPLDFGVAVARLGVERLIYTDIKRDGMLTGPNIEQTVALARATGVHVSASGGVSSLADIARLLEAGEPLVDSVIVGKALYEKKFTLKEALRLAS
jgi:phosphoribosylformimino-5-aminoimidazole carboxamide ribotide isomerase